MPRNGSGTYTLPQAPFVAGTTISSAAVNSDLSDIASALTGSLPRDGQAGMSGALKNADGSAVNPSITFTADPNTGFYRVGSDVIGVAVAGVNVASFTTGGLVGQMPVGAVIDYANSNNGAAPATWLLCYGQAVLRSTYAALFAVCGTTFGSGDGSTTFNLPDLRGVVTVGHADMGGGAPTSRLTSTYYGADPSVTGNVGGSQSKTLITANLPAYTPSGSVGVNDPGHIHGVSGVALLAGAFNNNGGGGGSFGAVSSSSGANTSSSFTGITASYTGSAQGGSSTAFSVVQPSMIMLKIIYAGV